jgi:hypothetical protein
MIMRGGRGKGEEDEEGGGEGGEQVKQGGEVVFHHVKQSR